MEVEPAEHQQPRIIRFGRRVNWSYENSRGELRFVSGGLASYRIDPTAPLNPRKKTRRRAWVQAGRDVERLIGSLEGMA